MLKKILKSFIFLFILSYFPFFLNFYFASLVDKKYESLFLTLAFFFYSLINVYSKKINPLSLLYKMYGYIFDLLFFGSSLVLLFNLVVLIF